MRELQNTAPERKERRKRGREEERTGKREKSRLLRQAVEDGAKKEAGPGRGQPLGV